jgi:hypothetical protein
MTRIRTIVVVSFTVPIVIIAAWIGVGGIHHTNLQRGYDAVQVGDSNQRVVELMGQPMVTEPCFQTSNCISYEYSVYFERWMIYVDQNNHVIDKINNEGLF